MHDSWQSWYGLPAFQLLACRNVIATGADAKLFHELRIDISRAKFQNSETVCLLHFIVVVLVVAMAIKNFYEFHRDVLGQHFQAKGHEEHDD